MARRRETRLWLEMQQASRLSATLSKPMAWLATQLNGRQLRRLVGQERGNTVFIIGSGPQLNDLSVEERRVLEAHPTIGVNRTQYALKPKYFLSAYPAEVLLARKALGRGTRIIHMRPTYEAPMFKNIYTVRRESHVIGSPLPTEFGHPIPTLKTLRNVVLGATHLAFILGAARIAYVGVEQTNSLHYYDLRPELRQQIIADLRSLASNDLFTVDHPYATLTALEEALTVPPDELRQSAFYVASHVETFADYFRYLRAQGVEVYATITPSVIHQAGAPLAGICELAYAKRREP